MPIYEYKGMDTSGSSKAGIIDADSPREARSRLREQNVLVTDLAVSAVSAEVEKREKPGAKKRFSLKRAIQFDRKVKGSEAMSIYTRQLATLLRSGIPLAQALSALIEQVEHKEIEAIFRDVRENVVRGTAFGDALANHPRLFDVLFVNMVRAGEASGNLDAVLVRLADYRTRQAQIQGKVKTALIYPMVMFVIGAGVVIFLVNVVVPRLVTIAKARGQTLPWMTQVLDATSVFLQNNLLALVAFFFAAWVIWKYFLLQREDVRLWWDGAKLRIPVLGNVLKKTIVSRFAVTMSTLLRSGVTVLDALDIVKTIMHNKVMENTLVEVRTRILEGADIATPLKKSGVFPPVVGYMVAVGEQTGQLDEMLQRIADAYEEEIETTTARALAILEPMMIVVMAFVVGFIVIAVMLPILQSSSSIRNM
ncbi:MAG: type II secretion system F family protein [Planctomycetota bacterium]|jgi:general secretion pathway protein F